MRTLRDILVVALLGTAGYVTFGSSTMTKSELIEAQTAYMTAHGKALQILEGNRLTEAGAVVEKLGKRVPPNIRVDVYETPNGEHGFQVIETNGDTVISEGFGPEAKERTWMRIPVQPTATST